MPKRLAILTTHPIQYQVPWFRVLYGIPDLETTVFYCLLPDADQQGDGFGIGFEWDIPLLDGYTWRVLRNRARHPSVTRFGGCDTPDVFAMVRRGRWNAVLVNGWVVASCLQALLACRLAGVPCFVRGESNALRPRAWWKRLVHRGLVAQYAACLTIGQANDRFYKMSGVPETRRFRTPYGVDNARFMRAADALRPERAALRAAWGIPPQAFVPLFCGKLIDKKRPLDVIDAVARLGTGAHLLVAGDGPLRGACEQRARDNGVTVTFTGFLNQSAIVKAYVASDTLVLPSDDGETWGLVVNEAMACGLPAVVSDRVGCHPDLILPGVTGGVFPMGDTVALGVWLARLRDDPAAATEMGRRACERVARGFGPEQVVKGVCDALRRWGRRDERQERPA